MSVHAIVLIQCEIDAIPEAAQVIADIDGVSEVYSVAGEFDLIAIVRVPDHGDLSKVIPGGIAKVDGVVTLRSQPLRHRRRQVHIEEEAHPTVSGRYDLLARQPHVTRRTGTAVAALRACEFQSVLIPLVRHKSSNAAESEERLS